MKSSNTILHQILSYKKKWILNQSINHPLNTLKTTVKLSNRNFYHTLFNKKNETIFILECKQASPSQGIICKDFNPIKIAHAYKNYATIISVLTEDKYFYGNFNILKKISNIVDQPILCKDFFISEWQIYFARLYHADAILLILSILNDQTYKKLANIAHTLQMGVLTEIANEEELKRAISLKAKIIGINNRNLHNLSININQSIILSENIPHTVISISESGIQNHAHIKKLKNHVNGFLIGTILMSQSKLNTAINKLILGENKICGLTKIVDAYFACKLGAIYGGLIFISQSPRYINLSKAKNIITTVKDLQYVGVFCNENINYIVKIANILNLAVIQLHGTEDQNYISILRENLPKSCHIWKSVNMNNQSLQKIPDLLHVDRYLLDNGGGSGKTFDWSILSKIALDNIMLAGGLTTENCKKAASLGCLGLDFNSGIEIQPGIKNHNKLKKIFQILRTY